MNGVAIWLGGVGAVLLAANVVITRRLWRSPLFERPQKLAQTVLIWVLPGSWVFVRLALLDRRPDDVHDTTVTSPDARGDAGDLGRSHGQHHDGG
jgi:hypothetical protein